MDACTCSCYSFDTRDWCKKPCAPNLDTCAHHASNPCLLNYSPSDIVNGVVAPTLLTLKIALGLPHETNCLAFDTNHEQFWADDSTFEEKYYHIQIIAVFEDSVDGQIIFVIKKTTKQMDGTESYEEVILRKQRQAEDPKLVDRDGNEYYVFVRFKKRQEHKRDTTYSSQGVGKREVLEEKSSSAYSARTKTKEKVEGWQHQGPNPSSWSSSSSHQQDNSSKKRPRSGQSPGRDQRNPFSSSSGAQVELNQYPWKTKENLDRIQQNCLNIQMSKDQILRCFHDLTGTRHTDPEEIKKTYKEFSLNNHPDKNLGDKERGRAYQVMSNVYGLWKKTQKKKF